MIPVNHPITGAALGFSLNDEILIVREELAKSPGRIARTLIKDGPLRVTLVGVRAGGELKEHRARGPVTIHVLDGEVEVAAGGRTWPLRTGALLGLDSGVPHAVRSAGGGVFLLTLVQHDAADDAPGQTSAA